MICQGEAEWQAYLQRLGITAQQAVKLVTEAALLGSAIEHGLSPELIVLSDGAKQFANKSACPLLDSYGKGHPSPAWSHCPFSAGDFGGAG